MWGEEGWGRGAEGEGGGAAGDEGIGGVVWEWGVGRRWEVGEMIAEEVEIGV